MNKEQLVVAVEEITGQGLPATTAMVEAMLQVLVHTVASGERVSLSGVGTLEPHIYDQTTRRNPQTNEPLEVPAKIRVRYRPSTRFNALTNGDIPLPATPAELDVKARGRGPRSRAALQENGQGEA